MPLLVFVLYQNKLKAQMLFRVKTTRNIKSSNR